jgi:hypothetical protein
VAEVPIERVGVKAKGLLIARCGDEAPRCRRGATHGNGLGTCHSKGASMVVEQDATAVTKFGFARHEFSPKFFFPEMPFVCGYRENLRKALGRGFASFGFRSVADVVY